MFGQIVNILNVFLREINVFKIEKLQKFLECSCGNIFHDNIIFIGMQTIELFFVLRADCCQNAFVSSKPKLTLRIGGDCFRWNFIVRFVSRMLSRIWKCETKNTPTVVKMSTVFDNITTNQQHPKPKPVTNTTSFRNKKGKWNSKNYTIFDTHIN